MDFYDVKKRTLIFKLIREADKYKYQGQLIIELALKMEEPVKGVKVSKLAGVIEKQTAQSSNSRVLLEASILSKQVKVDRVNLLQKDKQTGEQSRGIELEIIDSGEKGSLADPQN